MHRLGRVKSSSCRKVVNSSCTPNLFPFLHPLAPLHPFSLLMSNIFIGTVSSSAGCENELFFLTPLKSFPVICSLLLSCQLFSDSKSAYTTALADWCKYFSDDALLDYFFFFFFTLAQTYCLVGISAVVVFFLSIKYKLEGTV